MPLSADMSVTQSRIHTGCTCDPQTAPFPAQPCMMSGEHGTRGHRVLVKDISKVDELIGRCLVKFCWGIRR